MEEKLNKIDDLSRSVDRVAHDVENLNMKFFVPKVDESIKALYVFVDESKKRTAMLRAKREFLEKAGVSSIGSLFSKVNIDTKGLKKSRL